jgi:hypothetical protein
MCDQRKCSNRIVHYDLKRKRKENVVDVNVNVDVVNAVDVNVGVFDVDVNDVDVFSVDQQINLLEER